MMRHNRRISGDSPWYSTKGKGLRNRRRSRKSSYSRRGKGKRADYYGTWHNGVKQE